VNQPDTLPTSRSFEQIDRFLLWCWTALGWQIVRDERGIQWLRVPEPLRNALGGCEAIPIQPQAASVVDGQPDNSPPTTDSLRKPTRNELLHVLGQLDRAAHAAPACQPTSVHELTPRLFDAYTVDGGHVMLGGCSLEDQPLIRSTGLVPGDQALPTLQLLHHFTTIEGKPVDPELLDSLHVDQLTPLCRPPRLAPPEMASWVSAGRQQLAEVTKGQDIEPLLVTVVWCKYLRCKLTFEIGDAQAELPFSSWAQWLTDGGVSPPPFVCPHTGRQSFHIVCTDDGVITVPEAVAVCEQSGRRVVETALATCELTGKRVLHELLALCPVSGQHVLAEQLVVCTMCGQQVSPKCSTGGQCRACRTLQSVRRDDLRIERVFGEYPKLAEWPRWRLGETDTVWILRGSSFFRRLLVVLDRESLAARRLAEAAILSRHWTPIAPEQWSRHLG
jgi:hypothetical protein